ncbi:uncharacterized protein LOC124472326, partial [Hypomesus transpacificus]|uniref:uncharacterized protein LOC124472326 n=1 Tax=Hypomesus transpacificus TaxID=137520 RepID=UPI001F085DFE
MPLRTPPTQTAKQGRALRHRIKTKPKLTIRFYVIELKEPSVKTDVNLRKVSAVCERCKPWKDEILANSKGPLFWNNCKPYLWPEKKWEVAKVYMARGNDKHTSVDQFDISAFLNLMTNCNHFDFEGKNKTVMQVTNVRNRVMHTASWHVKREDLEVNLQRIRELGRALEGKAPNIRALDDDINQLQNIDFSLIIELTKGRAQGHTSAGVKHSENMLKLQKFLSQEQQILKDQLESLSKCYEEDREKALTQEELQVLRVFLEVNKDLAQSLAPQWDRLREVQKTVEQHGQQINTLTGRVDVLEQNSPDFEFGAGILMFKNHLFEETKKRGWPEPIFSERRESAGYRGIVKVNGQTFTGSTVCGSIKRAHQEVSKKALVGLPNQTADLSQPANDQVEVEASNMPPNQTADLSQPANDQVEVEASNMPPNQTADLSQPANDQVEVEASNMPPNQTADLSQPANDQVEGEASNMPSNKLRKLSVTGLAFYGSVKVDLNHDICEEGHEGDAVKSAYMKLALLLGLQVSPGSSYKETALQYCQRRDVPLPQEISQSTGCTLKFSGPITYHDQEGSNKKKQAQQQAAKRALQVLCEFLGKSEVKEDNYIGALKELLEARGQSKPVYDVTDRRGGTGEERGAAMVEETGEERGVAMVETGEERGAAMVEETGEE